MSMCALLQNTHMDRYYVNKILQKNTHPSPIVYVLKGFFEPLLLCTHNTTQYRYKWCMSEYHEKIKERNSGVNIVLNGVQVSYCIKFSLNKIIFLGI